MSKKLIIKGGTIVNADSSFNADILCEDGLIKEIGEDIKCPDAKIVDATGKLVIPGEKKNAPQLYT